MDMTDSVDVKALGMGINKTALEKALPELESACNRKIEAAEDFKTIVQVVALSAGILPGVLSQYVTARCNDSVKKKATSAEQLSFLFAEIGV